MLLDVSVSLLVDPTDASAASTGKENPFTKNGNDFCVKRLNPFFCKLALITCTPSIPSAFQLCTFRRLSMLLSVSVSLLEVTSSTTAANTCKQNSSAIEVDFSLFQIRPAHLHNERTLISTVVCISAFIIAFERVSETFGSLNRR